MQNLANDPFGIVGQVLDGQFRVEGIVGEGGFSAVYRGFHLGLQEPIAIKCLKLPPSVPTALGEQFERRFRDESRILYRLSQGNLNIVRSIAGGTWQAPTGLLAPYMILEWLEGRPLASELTARREAGHAGRSLTEVLTLFESAADGLGYAHAQGVVHRDLNPGNLFLVSAPQGTRMKVLDFGVAKILDESTLKIARTQTVGHFRVFAPAYGAPEQFDEAVGRIGPASDVYSFALILLEALRDRAVNECEHLGEFALRATDASTRPTPKSLGVAVSDEVEQVFVRATKLDPRERWQTVRAFWQALTKAARAADERGQPARAVPGATRGQSWKKSTKIGVPPPYNPPAGSSEQVAAPAAEPPQARAALPSFVEEGDDEEPTRVGSSHEIATEIDDEVTRVQMPGADVLRGLAAIEAKPPRPETPHAAPPAANTTQLIPGDRPGEASANAAAALPAPPKGGLAQTLPLAAPQPDFLRGSSPGPMGAPPPGPMRPSHPGPMRPSYPGPLGAPSPGPMGAAPPGPMRPSYPGEEVPPHPHPSAGHPPHGYPASQQMAVASYGQGPVPLAPPHVAPAAHAGTEVGPAFGGHAAAPKQPPSSRIGVMALAGAILLAGIGGALAILATAKRSVEPTESEAPATVAEPSPPEPVVEPPPPVPRAAEPSESAAEPEPVETASPSASDDEAAPSPEAAEAPAPEAPAPEAQPAPQAQKTTPRVPTRPRAPAKTAAPVDPHAFNEPQARSRLAQANGVLAFCKRKDGVTGPGTAAVTFGPDGAVTGVRMDAPYAGTTAGDCVAGQFKRVKVSPFEGAPRTIKHAFSVPK